MILKCLLTCAVLFIIEVELRVEYFGVKFSRAECEIFNHQIVRSISCKSKIVNRTRLKSGKFTLQPGVQLDNLYFMIICYHKFGTVFRPSLIKIEQELCAFLQNRKSSKMFPIVEKAWKKHGNMLDACPISGRRYNKDIEVDLFNFPAQIIPAGDWRLDFTVSTIVNNTKTKLFSIEEYYDKKK